jgi:BirA family biotin operon repressor/biotin-[acetyl-CoA-carboxylase] ligase
MICGLALLSAVRSLTGVTARLKWPNDLIVESMDGTVGWQKLAGMLSELGMDGNGPGWLVVGIGLNVNISAELLPRLAPNATSLLALTGHCVDRVALLDHLLSQIEVRYEALRSGTDPLPAWQDALAWMGEVVEVSTTQETITGLALGVDETGALEVRTARDEIRRFSAGDVSLRPVSHA